MELRNSSLRAGSVEIEAGKWRVDERECKVDPKFSLAASRRCSSEDFRSTDRRIDMVHVKYACNWVRSKPSCSREVEELRDCDGLKLVLTVILGPIDLV